METTDGKQIPDPASWRPQQPDLALLEQRVGQLVAVCAQLHKENDALRTRQETHAAERATLIEKREMAKNRLEQMIDRLKLMERGS